MTHTQSSHSVSWHRKNPSPKGTNWHEQIAGLFSSEYFINCLSKFQIKSKEVHLFMEIAHDIWTCLLTSAFSHFIRTHQLQFVKEIPLETKLVGSVPLNYQQMPPGKICIWIQYQRSHMFPTQFINWHITQLL